MPSCKLHYVKNVKIPLIIYSFVIIIGVLFGIFRGISLDINFKGGSRFTYTFSGELDIKNAEKTIEDSLGKDVTVSENSSLSGDTTKLIVSLVADESLTTEAQTGITKALTDAYPDNNIELGDSTTVSPTVAGSFFAKSLFAVALAAIFVIIYVGIRFRRIGGVSAAIMSLVALVFDIICAFATCAIFKLQIDANFMAVILTILGYSLNDTIVIYDRIRENRKYYPSESVGDVVDLSLNQVINRNLMTSITTFLAIVTIIVVAEFFGLTTLRTFAIPMAVGIVSGCFSSLCVSGPLWVKWQTRNRKPKAKKK